MNDRQNRALNGAVLSWRFKVPVLVVMALFSITCGSNPRRKTAVASPVGILMLIAIVTMMVVAAPSAFAASSRRYEGTTSQGLRVWFELGRRADGSLRLERWEFKKAELSCDDGSVLVWGIPGSRQPLHQGVVALDEVNPWGATHLHGTFRPRSAEGTFRYTVGALTDDKQPQLCTTGELTWTADRTGPPVAESAPGWRDVALEGLESGQDINPSASLSRRYQGKTSQDKRIAFDLDQEDDGSLTLVGWFFKARATCGDGTAWGFATGSNHPVPLDGRNLALEQADATGALDLHGAFRPKTADGTLRWTMAALTADEQAQLCTTGDHTWIADRVDESNMPSGTGVAGPEIRNDFARPTPLAAERRLR